VEARGRSGARGWLGRKEGVKRSPFPSLRLSLLLSLPSQRLTALPPLCPLLQMPPLTASARLGGLMGKLSLASASKGGTAQPASPAG